MTVVNEHIIIQKVLNGDVHAFEEIVISYQDMVYTLAFRILKNREEAEEIAQDVFIKIYQSLSKFNQKSKLSTWIYRITYNAAINRFRSSKRQPTTNEIDSSFDLVSDSTPDALLQLNIEEKKQFVVKAIQKLGETDRIIITLYYYEELSVTEISEIVGISKQNVKVKLHRSRQKLYNELVDKVDKEIIHYEYN